ncbi:MAG TPA: hypothetical protein PKH07_07230, partial [bacterium]|nr:hypothetical protein [bacterium]
MVPTLAVSMLTLVCLNQSKDIGERPYEMEWANRREDAHQPLVDFEYLAGWHIETRDASAELVRTREQQIWGTYVAKLTYCATGDDPEVLIRPPSKVPIHGAWDALTLWVYGNNWEWAP